MSESAALEKNTIAQREEIVKANHLLLDNAATSRYDREMEACYTKYRRSVTEIARKYKMNESNLDQRLQIRARALNLPLSDSTGALHLSLGPEYISLEERCSTAQGKRCVSPLDFGLSRLSRSRLSMHLDNERRSADK
jgi:hypothetical protein